jgi:hypothetical protein
VVHWPPEVTIVTSGVTKGPLVTFLAKCSRICSTVIRPLSCVVGGSWKCGRRGWRTLLETLVRRKTSSMCLVCSPELAMTRLPARWCSCWPKQNCAVSPCSLVTDSYVEKYLMRPLFVGRNLSNLHMQKSSLTSQCIDRRMSM